MRIRPATPRTAGFIAKHATPESYHWVLVTNRHHARPEPLSRLLAVAYLDEANGLLGRGDPRWAVPRAYLRTSGELETEERPAGVGAEERPRGPALRRDALTTVERSAGEGASSLAPFVRRELARIAAWLGEHHADYLARLARAFRTGAPEDGFERLTSEAAEARGLWDPTGRGLLAPSPPPVVTRTPAPPSPERSAPASPDRLDRLLPWRRVSPPSGR